MSVDVTDMHTLPIQDEKGNPFTPPKWTKYIQRIFIEHSGQSVGPTTLRSAFVTYLMSGDVTTDETILASVAHAMRHSTRYVSMRVYGSNLVVTLCNFNYGFVLPTYSKNRCMIKERKRRKSLEGSS